MSTSFYSGKSRMLLAQALLMVGVSMLTGCAGSEKRLEPAAGFGEAEAVRADPYEGFNRSMYSFNMKVDQYFFKPVADGYKFITPDFVETGVSNFFNNLKGINVVLNDILQGKLRQSASDTGRFLANTTLGVAGLFDVASHFGLQGNVEDFGQTLAVWGVGEGPYLVLPFLGPTTIRDGGGGIVDRAANPGTYVPFTGILEGINERANAQGALNFIDEAALDPYVFTRESFLQYRRHLISDGEHDGRYDPDLEAALEDAADSGSEASEARNPVAAEGKSGAAAPSSDRPDDQVVGRHAAFDKLVQSFEETSLKIDRLSQKSSGMRLGRFE